MRRSLCNLKEILIWFWLSFWSLWSLICKVRGKSEVPFDLASFIVNVLKGQTNKWCMQSERVSRQCSFTFYGKVTVRTPAIETASNWRITVHKTYSSLLANNRTAKLSNKFPWTRGIHSTDKHRQLRQLTLEITFFASYTEPTTVLFQDYSHPGNSL